MAHARGATQAAVTGHSMCKAIKQGWCEWLQRYGDAGEL